MSSSKMRATIDVLASLAMLSVAILVGWKQLAPSRAAPSTIERAKGQVVEFGNAPTKGKPSAKIGVVIFSDFECSYCGSFARTIGPQLDRRYVDSGAVIFAFKHKPLTSIHANALMAAKATQCAAEGGEFWTLHDQLFARQQILSTDEIRRLGRKLKLGATWDSCVEGDTVSDAVASDIAEAGSLGVSGTPAFLIGPVVGAGKIKVTDVVGGLEPLDNYVRILDGLIAQGNR